MSEEWKERLATGIAFVMVLAFIPLGSIYILGMWVQQAWRATKRPNPLHYGWRDWGSWYDGSYSEELFLAPLYFPQGAATVHTLWRPHDRVTFYAAWFDGWLGYYWDRAHRTLYLQPFFWLGLKLEF